MRRYHACVFELLAIGSGRQQSRSVLGPIPGKSDDHAVGSRFLL